MAQTVLLNMAVLCFVLTLWTACGMGPTLLLAPKTRFVTWFLLSPLIGLMLIASIGVARLEFFLLPADPLVDCSLLIILALLCWFVRRDVLRRRFRRCGVLILKLLYPYLSFLLLFALVFRASGFETLSTASDEVEHGIIENQIIQNVHRGTADDNPIMRLDHYVLDYPSKDLTYLRNTRKGSDMLTIASAMLLRISPERMYPVTFASLTIVLGLGVLFLCRYGFNLSVSRGWPVPLFF